ncbi:MAG: hypothetical protein ABI718_17455 [Acidobacteriota bacterium]
MFQRRFSTAGLELLSTQESVVRDASPSTVADWLHLRWTIEEGMTMEENWDTRQMAARAASVAAVWGVSKLLETEQGEALSDLLDRKISNIGRTVGKKATKAKRNASHSPILIGVGVLAIAVAVIVVVRATSTS